MNKPNTIIIPKDLNQIEAMKRIKSEKEKTV